MNPEEASIAELSAMIADLKARRPVTDVTRWIDANKPGAVLPEEGRTETEWTILMRLAVSWHREVVDGADTVAELQRRHDAWLDGLRVRRARL